MKYRAVIATDKVDRNNDKFSVDALMDMVGRKKHIPITVEFDSQRIVGKVDSLFLTTDSRQNTQCETVINAPSIQNALGYEEKLTKRFMQLLVSW